MCNVSHITCHGLRVTCHVSPVTCQNIFLHKKNLKRKLKNHFFFIVQSGGAGWWRVCYQRGLPRLVLKWTLKHQSKFPLGTVLLHTVQYSTVQCESQ